METQDITIDPIEDATFNYSAASYCLSEAIQTPTITGIAGGSFTVIPATGLTVDTATGEFDPSISTIGAYDVTYTTTGTCPGMETVTVTIDPLDDATFAYAAGSFCVDETTPQIPTITGEAGGAFTVTPTAGIVLDPATGEFIPNATTPGTYDITYTTTDPCLNSSMFSVTITAMGDATFNYSAAAYCTNDTLQTPTITGTAGGSFTVVPATGLTVDPATGEFDPTTATTGAYDITYTTSGGCVGSETVNVTIDPQETATITYATPFCITDNLSLIHI